MGLAGKRVILKQWYWAPVTRTVYKNAAGEVIDAADAFVDEDQTTLADGVTAEVVTANEWILNGNFGNDGYTVAEGSVTYRTETITRPDGSTEDVSVVDTTTDEAYAEGLTTIIPNATYLEGVGVTVLTDGDSTADDGSTLTVAGDYLFDRLPTRFVAARHGDIMSEPEDEDEQPVVVDPSNLAVPAGEYLAGYTVEVLGGAVDTTNAEAIQGRERAGGQGLP